MRNGLFGNAERYRPSRHSGKPTVYQSFIQNANTRVYGGEKFFLTFRGILAGLAMNKYTVATTAMHIYT